MMELYIIQEIKSTKIYGIFVNCLSMGKCEKIWGKVGIPALNKYVVPFHSAVERTSETRLPASATSISFAIAISWMIS